jgi:hypothetical protein
MADENAREALRRLRSIDWRCKEDRRNSLARLMQEYLRRAALWGKELNATDRWPFFDIAKCISENLCFPTELETSLEECLSKFNLRPTIKKSCLWYLKWSALKDRALDPKVDPEESRESASVRFDFKAWLSEPESHLPDPYEPLILLYERGGIFYTEHGFIMVGSAGIPAMITGWTAYDRQKPFVDLDEQTLDRLDAVAALH